MNNSIFDLSASRQFAREAQSLPLPLDFHATDYLLLNPDVAKSKVNPIEHWLKFGFFEGRRYTSQPGELLRSRIPIDTSTSVFSESSMRQSLGTIGIGIITYNRPKSLETLIKSIFASSIGNCQVVVFEDGSDSSEVLEHLPVLHVRGNTNRGVVVNKNRALNHFWSKGGVDQVILLEDDLEISRNDWLQKWSEAIQQFGHLNYNPRDSVSPPLLTDWLTGQVHGIQLNTLTKWLGFLNPSFKGYGHGHTEWTYRHLRCGQGGFFDLNGKANFLNYGYGIENRSAPSQANEQQIHDNFATLKALQSKPQTCWLPWSSESSRIEFFDLTSKNHAS